MNTHSAPPRETSPFAGRAEYELRVTDDEGELVAVSQAIAYRKKVPPPFY